MSNIVNKMFYSVQNQCQNLHCSGLLCAVSGGADSVCMLHILSDIAHRSAIKLHAAHCNFHLRGEESDRDMKFVEELSAKLGITLHIKHFNVTEYCTTNRVSVEQACRDLRYNWFHKLCQEHNLHRIAVAHNSDDNAETFLLNMLRGSGIAGLCAMISDDGKIFRPMLNFSRKDILNYLNQKKQQYVTDSSNLQSEFRRNFLRNKVLPLIETEWPGAKQSINHTIKNLQSQLPIYNTGIRLAEKEFESNFIPMHLIRTQPQSRALLHTFLIDKCSTPQSMLDEILTVGQNDKPAGRKWATPQGELLMRSNGLYFIPTDNNSKKFEIEIEKLECNADTLAEMRKDRDHYHAYFPTNLPPYIFRVANPKDRIEPLGMKHSQKVARIIKDAHVPPTLWKEIQVMEQTDNGRILWIPGLKRSRHMLLSTKDTEMLRIKVKGH